MGKVGGGEVGFHNGASKPDTQLDPGFRKHPRLRHGRKAGSAVSRVYSLGNPAPSAEAQRRRRCATMDVIYPRCAGLDVHKAIVPLREATSRAAELVGAFDHCQTRAARPNSHLPPEEGGLRLQAAPASFSMSPDSSREGYVSRSGCTHLNKGVSEAADASAVACVVSNSSKRL